jgi:hypothetical protein
MITGLGSSLYIYMGTGLVGKWNGPIGEREGEGEVSGSAQ